MDVDRYRGMPGDEHAGGYRPEKSAVQFEGAGQGLRGEGDSGRTGEHAGVPLRSPRASAASFDGPHVVQPLLKAEPEAAHYSNIPLVEL